MAISIGMKAEGPCWLIVAGFMAFQVSPQPMVMDCRAVMSELENLK
jgi:hypothetical protein